MSGWDALVVHEVAGTRHPDIAWEFEAWKTKQGYAYYGPTVRTAFTAGAEWVLARQGEWESLTEREAIEELRRGVRSVFYPIFQADPRITLVCPHDGGRVVVSEEGICDGCGYDFAR